MKRIAVVAALFMTVGLVSAPAQAEGDRDVVRIRATYSIPEDLALVEDPGELNIGCSGGEYTLVDGVFTKRAKATFVPSEEAWNQGLEGASISVQGRNSYTGLWGVDSDPEARFYLVANDLRYEFTQGTDGSGTGDYRWIGAFINVDTHEVAEYWLFNTPRNIVRGTCPL